MRLLAVMQEWLQFFAWTESSKEAKHAERQSHMPAQHQHLLAGKPIFCFETAIKLLYWCGFVYEHDEVISGACGCQARLQAVTLDSLTYWHC